MPRSDQRIELHEIQSATRPARVAWLLAHDITNSELERVIQWSAEHIGLWRSAMWQLGATGRLSALGEHLLRKYDPDVVYSVRTEVDEDYARACWNPFEVFSDKYVLEREEPAAHVLRIATLEAAEPQKRPVDRRVFEGDWLRRLWASSQLGILSDAVVDQLIANGTPVNTTSANMDEKGELAAVISLALDPVLPPQGVSPSAIQNRHLALMYRPRDDWYPTPAAVVIGDSLSDLCLYWTLRALRSGVYWAPSTGLAEWSALTHCLRSLIRHRIPSQHRSTALVSTTSSHSDLTRLAMEIGPAPEQANVQPTTALRVEDIDSLLPSVMVEQITYSAKSDTLVFHDSISGTQLPKASKGHIALDEPSRLSLYQEISLLDHRVLGKKPYNDRFEPAIMESRASREGWSFNPIRMMTFAYDTWDTAQTGSRLMVRDSLDECLTVFPPNLHARLSSAGDYLTRAIALFDGPLDAAAFLTQPPVARLLDAYKRTSKKRADKEVPGELLHERRYLDFQDIAQATALDGDPLRALLVQLIARRVLRRGFAFHCPACRWATFYPPGSFGDELECRQCSHRWRWQLADTHQAEAPELFYGLDEIIYRLAESDGHSVLRALSWLSQDVTSYLVAPGVDLDWPGDDHPWEVDSVLLIDGRLVLLEVKNSSTVEQRQLNRYQSLAERLSADEVCLVSTREWDLATTVRIEGLRAGLAQRYIKVRHTNLELARLP